MEGGCSLKSYMEANGKTIFGAFFFTVFFSHGYAMGNLVGNNDTMGIVSGNAGAGTASGRWFLDILVRMCRFLFGDVYFLPWFNLLLGFFLIACCSALILYLFQIKSKAAMVLVTSLMIVFPATASMALYGYTFHFNMFSLFLAVSSLFFCRGSIRSAVFSVVLIALSLGIYQAYLPFMCAVLVLLWLKELSDGKSCKEVFRSILFGGCVILCGLFLYLLLTKLFCSLFHVSLSSYKGIDKMAEIPSAKKIFLSVVYAYGFVFGLPLKNYFGLSASFALRLVILGYYLLSLLTAAGMLRKMGGNWLRKVMFIGLLLLLPPASNFIFFMVGGNKMEVYAAMLYGMVAIFLFLPLFFPFAAISNKKNIVQCIISAAVLFWGWYDNGVYTASHHVIEQNIAVWNRIIAQVESLEGYDSQMPVCIIGEHPFFSSVNDNYHDFDHLVTLEYVCDWSLPHFLDHYLGWKKHFIDEPPRLPEELQVYPDSKSMMIVDGVVIMRFE